MSSQFPQPDTEKDELLRTGPNTTVSVHVKTWYCQQCGRAIGQGYALHAWNNHGDIICPDCLHTSRQEEI